jgi:hypothetical protein
MSVRNHKLIWAVVDEISTATRTWAAKIKLDRVDDGDVSVQILGLPTGRVVRRVVDHLTGWLIQ